MPTSAASTRNGGGGRRDREQQQQQQQQPAGELETAAPGTTTPAPTGGALFNRPNPLDTDHGNFVNPYVRSEDRFVGKRGELMLLNAHDRTMLYAPRNRTERKHIVATWDDPVENRCRRYVPVYGHDFTSVSIASHRKYRIPATSVVNKVGDQALCCCGWRLTAAQWIWFLNLFCFLAHTFMVFLTLHMAYWRWDRSMWSDTEHVTVHVYRITQVPTPEMIANNETKWSPGWNNRTIGGGNEFFARDNGLPVNFATLTLSFFAVSAVFHLWALVVGLFEVFWFIYWRQMDDAFCLALGEFYQCKHHGDGDCDIDRTS